MKTGKMTMELNLKAKRKIEMGYFTKKPNCVAIVSGGLDSVTMLHWLIKTQHKFPLVLSFFYNQKHNQELASAVNACEHFGLPHKIIYLEEIMGNFTSALTTESKKIPRDHYTHRNQKQTVVPNRNMIMLSIAAGFAENLKINKVYYGAHSNDHAIYPDCRPEFVEAVSKAARLGTYSNVEIISPFNSMTKADIVALGSILKVPFANTWSCYEGGITACGKCGTCQERLEAFYKNRLKDPLQYKSRMIKQDGVWVEA